MTHKPARVSPADLIELLLDADETTRKLLIFEALQTGALRKSEAEQIIDQLIGLERAAAARPAAMITEALVA